MSSQFLTFFFIILVSVQLSSCWLWQNKVHSSSPSTPPSSEAPLHHDDSNARPPRFNSTSDDQLTSTSTVKTTTLTKDEDELSFKALYENKEEISKSHESRGLENHSESSSSAESSSYAYTEKVNGAESNNIEVANSSETALADVSYHDNPKNGNSSTDEKVTTSTAQSSGENGEAGHAPRGINNNTETNDNYNASFSTDGKSLISTAQPIDKKGEETHVSHNVTITTETNDNYNASSSTVEIKELSSTAQPIDGESEKTHVPRNVINNTETYDNDNGALVGSGSTGSPFGILTLTFIFSCVIFLF